MNPSPKRYPLKDERTNKLMCRPKAMHWNMSLQPLKF